MTFELDVPTPHQCQSSAAAQARGRDRASPPGLCKACELSREGLRRPSPWTRRTEPATRSYLARAPLRWPYADCRRDGVRRRRTRVQQCVQRFTLRSAWCGPRRSSTTCVASIQELRGIPRTTWSKVKTKLPSEHFARVEAAPSRDLVRERLGDPNHAVRYDVAASTSAPLQ
jgi:hypothetical protein